jgi:hypothetical protein
MAEKVQAYKRAEHVPLAQEHKGWKRFTDALFPDPLSCAVWEDC